MSKLQARGGDSQADFSISLRTITPICSGVVVLLLTVQLAAPCALYISCSQLLPTLSYTAALFGFDRWFTAVIVAVSLYLGVFFLSIYPTLATASGNWERLWLVLALGSNILLWMLAVFDEEQGAKFLRRKQVHEAVAVSYLTVISYVSVSAIDVLEQRREMMKAKEVEWLKTLQRLVYFDLLLSVFVLLAFKLSISIHSNWLWNESVEAIAEWTLLSSASFLPAVWSQVLPDSRIEVTFSTHNRDSSD